MGDKTRRCPLGVSFCASGLERCIAEVSLTLGRLSRRVGPPIKLKMGALPPATRALQDTLRTLDKSGARMKLQQTLAPIGVVDCHFVAV